MSALASEGAVGFLHLARSPTDHPPSFQQPGNSDDLFQNKTEKRTWIIFVDLYSEFSGTAGAYAILSFVLPGALLGPVMVGWAEDRSGLITVGAAALFLSLFSIAGYSAYWAFWAHKPERRTWLRMQDFHTEILAAKRRRMA